MTAFSNQAAVSDVLTFTAGALSAVAAGGYSFPSDLIDNTPSGPHGVSYINGILRLSFSTALTAGAGAPYVTLYPLAALDGTNLVNPPGANAASPRPNQKQIVAQLIASAAFSVLDFGDPQEGFPLGPFKYGFQFLDSSGVAWSGGGTITATLYRWNQQAT